MMDFKGAKLSTSTDFDLLRELDQRRGDIGQVVDGLDDARPASHAEHSLERMIRQRVCQMAARYEDCNDAGFPRFDTALRLSLGRRNKFGAGQSALLRLEKHVLGTGPG